MSDSIQKVFQGTKEGTTARWLISYCIHYSDGGGTCFHNILLDPDMTPLKWLLATKTDLVPGRAFKLINAWLLTDRNDEVKLLEEMMPQ